MAVSGICVREIQRANREPRIYNEIYKVSSQMIKGDLKVSNPIFPEEFRVDAIDRKYQLWERNPLSIDLWTHPVFLQKFSDIHWIPVGKEYV
jgi:putative transposase